MRAVFFVLLLAACSRSGVRIGRASRVVGNPPDAAVDADADADADANVVDPACVPATEACNALDDDCDGTTDEDIAPIACEAGGFAYCIAGATSDCPRSCEVCVPGGSRVCFLSYCTFWGIQRCSGDGQTFGRCTERRAPRDCIDIAVENGMSAEVEQCCIDRGDCCLDTFDLDGDGDVRESLGACDGVLCE